MPSAAQGSREIPARRLFTSRLAASWRAFLTHSAAPLLILVFVWCAAKAWAGDAEPKLDLPPPLSLWHAVADIQENLGYKDNVTLAHTDPPGSAFEQATLEFMVFRLPRDNWQFSFMASGYDRRYFDSSAGVDGEQNGAAFAELVWTPGKHWRSTTSLKYFYVNQVLDLAGLTGVMTRQQFLGHSLSADEGWRKDLGLWWAEATTTVSRYFYKLPLDSFWEVGPCLSFGRALGQNSNLSLSYQIHETLFDTREQVRLDGSLVAGSRLQFRTQLLSLLWEQHWGEKSAWRSATQLSFALNTDNGSGYFDYFEPRLSEQLRYGIGPWEFSLDVAAASYAYQHLPVSATDSSPLQRVVLDCGLRVKRQLGKSWKIFGGYDYEYSLSNQSLETYQANVGQVGVEYDF